MFHISQILCLMLAHSKSLAGKRENEQFNQSLTARVHYVNGKKAIVLMEEKWKNKVLS